MEFKLDKKKKIIAARTGAGKTYAAIKLLKSIDKKSLFLVPFKALRDQIVAEYNLSTDPAAKITVACPEKLIVHQFKDKEVIIIDEIHLMLKSKIYRPIYRQLLDYFKDKYIIGLTGTPIELPELQDFYFEDKGIKKEEKLFLYTVEFKEELKKKINYRAQPVLLAKAILEKIKDDFPFIVIYANNKSHLLALKPDLYLTRETVEDSIFDLLINKEKIYSKIIRTGKLPEERKVIGLTDIFITGLNIYNQVDKVAFIVLWNETISIEDIIQAISRFRRAKEFHVYLIKDYNAARLEIMDNQSLYYYLEYIKNRTKEIKEFKKYFDHIEEQKIIIDKICNIDLTQDNLLLNTLKSLNFRIQFINFLLRDLNLEFPAELLAAASYYFNFKAEEAVLITLHLYHYYKFRDIPELIKFSKQLYQRLQSIYKSPNQKYKAIALATPNRPRIRIQDIIIMEKEGQEKLNNLLMEFIKELKLDEELPRNITDYIKFCREVLYRALGIYDDLDYLIMAKNLRQAWILKFIDKYLSEIKDLPIFIPVKGKKPLIKWKEKGLHLFEALNYPGATGVAFNIKSLGWSYLDIDLKKVPELKNKLRSLLKVYLKRRFNLENALIRHTPNDGLHFLIKGHLDLEERHNKLIEYFKSDRLFIIAPEYPVDQDIAENFFEEEVPEDWTEFIKRILSSAGEDINKYVIEDLDLRPREEQDNKYPELKEELSLKLVKKFAEEFKEFQEEEDKALKSFLIHWREAFIILWRAWIDKDEDLLHYVLKELFPGQKYRISKNYIAVSCPFHPPDNNPSFIVYLNPDKVILIDYHIQRKIVIPVEA